MGQYRAGLQVDFRVTKTNEGQRPNFVEVDDRCMNGGRAVFEVTIGCDHEDLIKGLAEKIRAEVRVFIEEHRRDLFAGDFQVSGLYPEDATDDAPGTAR